MATETRHAFQVVRQDARGVQIVAMTFPVTSRRDADAAYIEAENQCQLRRERNGGAAYFVREINAPGDSDESTEDQEIAALVAVKQIQQLMSGKEWSADTLDAIAAIMDENGFPLADYEG